MRTPETHPVSAALEAALVAEMNRHPILVWLDRDNHYGAFVDDLSARQKPRFAAPVLALRGSYVELIVELEAVASGVDESPLLLHVPYANEESIKETPLFEIYAAGYRFRKRLDTLIQEAAAGRVPPDELTELLAQEEPTLEVADAWMSRRLDQSAGELAAILRSLDLTAVVDDLRRIGPLSRRMGSVEARQILQRHLAAHVGLRVDWPYPTTPRPGEPPKIEAFGDVVSSWALCVEFAHDLKRPTVAPPLAGLADLPPPLSDAALALAHHLRVVDADGYTALANDVARMIDEERSAGGPGELGRIDTFRFEEEKLYVGALDALQTGQWDTARQWSHDRLEGSSVWLERDPERKSAWILVREAAELGAAVASSELDYSVCHSLVDAASEYADQGAPIDRLHRHLEQSREARLYSRVPCFEELRAALDATRVAYWGWAESMARAWSALCEGLGALPTSQGQQRRIFEDVVRPLLDDNDKTVLFLVDALRFEMAQELLEQIGRPSRTNLRLSPRLAELPSVTEVGMNVLAPAAQAGKLRPVLDKKQRRFVGFQAAEFMVNSPATRKKAMFHRAGGGACPWHELADLLTMSAGDLRASLRQSRLAIVHSIEIDAAGEKGAGLSVFAGVIRKLRKAYKLLREAGVRRFVITSDHGFLLRRPGDPVVAHGQGFDAMPRYAIYENVAPDDRLGVPMRTLDYLDVDRSLLFPRGLEVFPMGKLRTYVHGGNSPQERVIPVLTLEHKLAAGSDDHRYVVVVEETSVRGELCSVRARVDCGPGQSGLAFADTSHIELDLRVVEQLEARAHMLGASGSATLQDGALQAEVGKPFEVLFRLTGPTPARVRVQLYHPSGTHAVESARVDERFAVTVVRAAASEPSANETATQPASNAAEVKAGTGGSPGPAAATEASAPSAGAAKREPAEDEWLEAYDDEGARRIFAHLNAYGSVSESQLIDMLGSPRKLRKFSRRFEDYAKRAPFLVLIKVVGTGKLYVKVSER